MNRVPLALLLLLTAAPAAHAGKPEDRDHLGRDEAVRRPLEDRGARPGRVESHRLGQPALRDDRREQRSVRGLPSRALRRRRACIQPIYAIKPGGSGDLTLAAEKTSSGFIAWSTQRGGVYTPTPVVYEDLLYLLSNQGVLSAYDARTGERIYQERVAGKGGAFSASPVAADGKLYLAGEDGDVFVVKTGRKPEWLATNPMGEVLMATPAISDGIVFVRGMKHVFAVAAK